MRRGILLIVALSILAGCVAPGHYPKQAYGISTLDDPVQCVSYARDVSGIEIYGNASTWWNKAAKHYARGHKPQVGAVLVLTRTKKLRHGHVAVVKRVINNRQIEVAHSNWGYDGDTRSKVYHNMLVEDVSPKNNWSRLRFWNYDSDSFGRPYAATGFIYNSKS